MSRKYKILIASLIFYFITVYILLFFREGDIATIIIAIATGITTITGAYYGANVFQKNKETNE